MHRDVKPGNILLTEDGTFKVCDFGIATSLDAGETTTRVPLGTPAYTAPERLRGLRATERSDLYALGVVLYEAAAGERPFAGNGAVAVAEAVVAGDHTDLHERRPDLSPAFVATVERALATDPADRFADAAEMRAALDRAARRRRRHRLPETVPLRPPARDTAVLPVRRDPRPSPRRLDLRRARRRASVVLVLVAVIAIGLLVSAGDDAPTPPTTAPATAPATTPAPVGTGLPAPLAPARSSSSNGRRRP